LKVYKKGVKEKLSQGISQVTIKKIIEIAKKE